MQQYLKGAKYQSLEPWPFDNVDSDYKITRGDSQASGRLDAGSNSGQFRMGIWSCTEGAFECTELGDELQTIVEGRLTLRQMDGTAIECGPGDSVLTRKGERVVWDIQVAVTKLFLTYNRDGQAE